MYICILLLNSILERQVTWASVKAHGSTAIFRRPIFVRDSNTKLQETDCTRGPHGITTCEMAGWCCTWELQKKAGWYYKSRDGRMVLLLRGSRQEVAGWHCLHKLTVSLEFLIQNLLAACHTIIPICFVYIYICIYDAQRDQTIYFDGPRAEFCTAGFQNIEMGFWTCNLNLLPVFLNSWLWV